MVRYAILGPIELCDGERRVAVGGPRQVALLALLLVNANRALSSDGLIDALWGDRGPAGAVKRLQVAIARLRRTLDPDGVQGDSVLRTIAGGYLLAVLPGELDAEVFQERLEEGHRALEAGEADRARDMLREALRMWHGPALAEVAYEEFAQMEIRRLEELRLAALEARVDCELQIGEHGGLIGDLETLVAAHPARERLAAQLMLALYRCGRQGDALEVYSRARAYLSGELGLEPGPALQALQAKVLAQSPALQRVSDEPGSAAAAAGRVTLPLPRSLHTPASSPFVGREAELERLRERWTEVCGGARSAVVMGGEAGIGKTRLASELARAVHEQGALVLYGRCDEGLAVPYQPFVEALRPYARAVGLDRLHAELDRLAPELGRLLPELTSLGEPIRADPESERFALFEAVAALIESATREQRVLLLVDDLHWAALPTLLLLRHLIRSERPLNVLLLGTYRETELDASHQLAQLLADLHRDASVQLLNIRGLDEQAIAALLQAADGNGLRNRAHELAHLLRTETAGNPFFVRELLAHLVESGAISRIAGRASPALTELDVPERLRHVIRNRVARLSQDAQRALRVAAVAGPTFSPALLEAVMGEAPGLLDALDEAVAAGLLTEAGHGEHAFGHALVRQTLYRELGSARRMRLHGQLGEALEATGAVQTHVELLAHHFAEAAAAGQADKAADYALAASRSAIARLGYEEAAGHCERGLEALALAGRPDDRRRCELLLALGEACSSAGEIDRARQACMQAADLADAIGDDQQLARAALGYCGPLFFSIGVATTEPSVGLLQRALDRLGAQESALRAQLMGRLAAALAYADGEHRRPALARQALEMARRVADKATLADVLATTHWSIRGPDSLHECLAVAQELAHLADEVGDIRLRTYAQQWLVDQLLELGEIEAVERELAAWQRLVEPLSKRHYLGWLLAVVRARHAHLGGRLEQCEAFARDALTHGYEGQDEPVAHTFGAQMLFVRREQARLDELVPAVEGFSERYPNISAWRCALAYVYAELGRTQEARDVLGGLARADFEDLPRDGLWLGTVATLCEVVALLDDVPRARSLYELLLPFADRCVVLLSFICKGSVASALGLLATVMSRYEEAASHFEAALEVNTRIGSPLWVAHTQHDYARMLLLRGRPADNERARQLLDEALAAVDELGLRSLAGRVRQLRLHGPGG